VSFSDNSTRIGDVENFNSVSPTPNYPFVFLPIVKILQLAVIKAE
jgi:hypothetical protein